MHKNFGLWIDHRKALIVTPTSEEGEPQEISSDMEKHVRFSSGSSEDGSAEDMRDRQYGNHLDAYYDRVIQIIQDADAILILGPGEAKGEFEGRLKHTHPKEDRLVTVETADKMTPHQVAAKVRQHFLVNA
jgi:stalled ribosome rescue protein Dom34